MNRMKESKKTLDKRIKILYHHIINEMQSYGTKPLQTVGTERRAIG